MNRKLVEEVNVSFRAKRGICFLKRPATDRGPHGNRLSLPKDRIIYGVICAYVMYVQHYVSVG